MKMFKLCSIMILAMTSLYFVGCADSSKNDSQKNDSPNDVVVKWLDAIAEGDFDEANEYMTNRGSKDILTYVEEQYNEDPKQIKVIAEQNKELMRLYASPAEINGDEAIIRGFDDTYADEDIVLKKVNGKWKIDCYD